MTTEAALVAMLHAMQNGCRVGRLTPTEVVGFKRMVDLVDERAKKIRGATVRLEAKLYASTSANKYNERTFLHRPGAFPPTAYTGPSTVAIATGRKIEIKRWPGNVAFYANDDGSGNTRLSLRLRRSRVGGGWSMQLANLVQIFEGIAAIGDIRVSMLRNGVLELSANLV